MSWAPIPRLDDNPIDRAMVQLLKTQDPAQQAWSTNLGVHLWVGRPEAVAHGLVRVWLHTKDCTTRESPQRVRHFVDDYHDGHCWDCDSLPLTYVRKRAWWPVRLVVWLLWRVCHLQISRTLGPARVTAVKEPPP